MLTITRAAMNSATDTPVVTANTPRGSRSHSTASFQLSASAAPAIARPAAASARLVPSQCTASAARTKAAVSSSAPGIARYRFISAPLEADRLDRSLRQEQREQEES